MTVQTEIAETTEPTLKELAEKAARAAYEATQEALEFGVSEITREQMLADAAAHMAVVQALATAAQIAE